MKIELITRTKVQHQPLTLKDDQPFIDGLVDYTLGELIEAVHRVETHRADHGHSLPETDCPECQYGRGQVFFLEDYAWVLEQLGVLNFLKQQANVGEARH